MKVFLFLTVLLLTIAVGAVTLNHSLTSVRKKHSTMGQQKLDKNSSLKKGKKTVDNLSFSFNNIKYQLEIIVPTTEEEFTQNRKNFTALTLKKYQEEPLPYQGEITNVSTCPKKFIPSVHHEKTGEKEIYIIKYFTGKSYSYRVCEENLIAYSTCNSFYLDKKSGHFFKLSVSTVPEENCLKTSIAFFENLSDL